MIENIQNPALCVGLMHVLAFVSHRFLGDLHKPTWRYI